MDCRQIPFQAQYIYEHALMFVCSIDITEVCLSASSRRVVLTCLSQDGSVAAVVLVLMACGLVLSLCQVCVQPQCMADASGSSAGGVDEPMEAEQQFHLIKEFFQVLVNAVGQVVASPATTLLAPQRGFL